MVSINAESMEALAVIFDCEITSSPYGLTPDAVGWKLTLPSGMSLSVQRSEQHYCSHGSDYSAEIAALDLEGHFVWYEEQIRGYQTFTDIALVIKELDRKFLMQLGMGA